MIKPIIFVWIPKTGGTSIHSMLKKSPVKMKKFTGRPKRYHEFNNRDSVTFGHASIASLTELGIIKSDYLETAFKFCFVRNPWDRLVSLYYYLTQKRNRKLGNTFNEFVNKLHSGEYPIQEIGLYNVSKLNQLNDSTKWINSLGMEFDFIGKYENFQADVQRLLETIGLDSPKRIPHLNKVSHHKYTRYYNDDLIHKVSELYKDEIELFEYQPPKILCDPKRHHNQDQQQ